MAGLDDRGGKGQCGERQAELARAQPNYERYKKMVATNVVGKMDYDQVEATLRKAEAEVTRTQAALTAEQGQLVVDLADRKQADAQLAQTQAALTAAKNDLDNTVIKAPVDGVVGNKGVQTGQYVKVGTQLMAVVPLAAGLCGRQLQGDPARDMRQGQPVEIAVDAYPNHKLIGTVESFAPAAARCSACCRRRTPPATSPRSCQRVPVRIAVPEGECARGLLRPGLSGRSQRRYARRRHRPDAGRRHLRRGPGGDGRLLGLQLQNRSKADQRWMIRPIVRR
jgi:membrane fusion protein (multidrug efflux system)